MKIITEKSRYHRFALYYDYSAEKVEFCRLLKESMGWNNFSYDSADGVRRWVFSNCEIVRLIKQRFPETELETSVKLTVEKEIKWKSESDERLKEVEIVKQKKETDFRVPGIKLPLYEYQNVGVEFLVASGGRAINADSPGAGKTIQSIAFAKYQGYKRILVVCPASVKFVWEGEIKKWTRFSSVIITSKTKLHEIPHDVHFWVINYDILKKFLPQLLKIHFDCVIGDEGHMLKNVSTQRTKAFRQIARNIESVILLTGTPLLSRPSELFSLLNIIDPKGWDNWYTYSRRYCNGHNTYFGYDASGASNIEELHERIKRYFIRRTKNEILLELPPKNHIKMPVELSKDVSDQYDLAARSLADYIRENGGNARSLQAEQLTQLNILRMLCARGKVPVAKELIDSIISSGEKTLVFSSFIDPLTELYNDYKEQAVILTGQSSEEERKEAVYQFQNNPEIKVFFGGIKSAGVGITLTAASNVIFLDYSWIPSDHIQAEDRVHRPSQEAQSVNIYQLHAIETIDDELQKTLEHKQAIFDEVIDGKKEQKIATNVMGLAINQILTNYKSK